MELKASFNNSIDYKESSTSRQRKSKHKEILEKKRVIDQLIKVACAEKDHLASFPNLRRFDQNGLSVFLESGRGDKLSSAHKQHIQKILKDNMERHYSSEWATEEKVKRREMVAPEARYIFVYEAHDVNNNEMMLDKRSNLLVGFVHYRFTLEEEIPVLYVYEIQLESHVQGRGLGKFLMQLIELIACKMGVKKNYEILCKVFDSKAKAVFEAEKLGKMPAPTKLFMHARNHGETFVDDQSRLVHGSAMADDSWVDYGTVGGEKKRRAAYRLHIMMLDNPPTPRGFYAYIFIQWQIQSWIMYAS